MPRPDEKVAIRTERLLLRPFGPDDAEDRPTYACDPGWGRFLGNVPPPDIQHAEQFIAQRIFASWSTEAFFAVVVGKTVIGGIGLHVREPDEIAALDYGIASTRWGKGLVPEAAQAVIDWGFPDGAAADAAPTRRLVRRQPRSTRTERPSGP